VSDPAAWLAAERERLGLSRAELAVRLGVATSTVARWERGERIAHPSMLRLALDGLARRGEATPAAEAERRAPARHTVTWRLWRAGGGH
jgi:transcriptional regulator with XRE-family HTH domain